MMTPREALYNICITLGPIPQSNRNENLSYDEVRLRDSIRALQNFIDYHDDSTLSIPDSAYEYKPRLDREGRDGKERLEAWREESKTVYAKTALGKTKY